MKKNKKTNSSRFIEFKESVLLVVSKIPRSKTMTYKTVARSAGFPGAYRAVGTALKNNFSSKIQCHRVICSNGKLGAYNRGVYRKKALLKEEGAIS